MGQITEAKLLPHDVDAEPIVQAAAALQPIIRGYLNEIDRHVGHALIRRVAPVFNGNILVTLPLTLDTCQPTPLDPFATTGRDRPTRLYRV